MAMGSTGTINITPEMMKNALNAVSEYQTTTNGLHDQLNEMMASLIPTNFQGSAADGFLYFYNNKIEPAIGEGLTNLLKTLSDIFESTLKAIPDTNGLDDQLGEENKK